MESPLKAVEELEEVIQAVLTSNHSSFETGRSVPLDLNLKRQNMIKDSDRDPNFAVNISSPAYQGSLLLCMRLPFEKFESQRRVDYPRHLRRAYHLLLDQNPNTLPLPEVITTVFDYFASEGVGDLHYHYPNMFHLLGGMFKILGAFEPGLHLDQGQSSGSIGRSVVDVHERTFQKFDQRNVEWGMPYTVSIRSIGGHPVDLHARLDAYRELYKTLASFYNPALRFGKDAEEQ